MVDLSISIVTHAPDLGELDRTLESLGTSVSRARVGGSLRRCRLMLVDNGPGDGWGAVLRERLKTLEERFGFAGGQVLTGHGNVGYGRGHNLATSRAREEFHLVLNPDVRLDQEAIPQALRFLLAHPAVGMLTPASAGPSGDRQFLCKNYPSMLDLGLRAWAPRWLGGLFRKRLERYEMRDQYRKMDSPFDVPIASGCFMFCRRKAWDAVGGFSPRYFLYFEDFDLSLRLGRHARIVFVPEVKIVHTGGGAGRKGWRHVLMFARSAAVFFNTHGWRLV